ncbi:hypothetical protein EDB81DRAFT_824385 [Dactylonectria macrodidyma]|uniref:Uncharacterized protein n=1 Tax=Dactylonectria macrodidyma TaxID=307937 RepID=A0A9P9IBD4_9HYPO|nr:hypothetical protein EDB81DRAFT_824385 [Dactylonectria macrodidyma]
MNESLISVRWHQYSDFITVKLPLIRRISCVPAVRLLLTAYLVNESLHIVDSTHPVMKITVGMLPTRRISCVRWLVYLAQLMNESLISVGWHQYSDFITVEMPPIRRIESVVSGGPLTHSRSRCSESYRYRLRVCIRSATSGDVTLVLGQLPSLVTRLRL